MSEERGTMTWFARPYFLLPLYVFPTFALKLMFLNMFKENISPCIIGSRGKIYKCQRLLYPYVPINMAGI